MYVVFYKDNYKWWSRLIKWWTNGNYSHCEFYSGKELIGISNEQSVRKLKQPLNKDKWDIFKLKKDITLEVEQFYTETQGSKYDWKGILWSCIFNRKKQNYKKYTCSEWLLNAIDNSCDIVYPKNYIMYSPTEVYEILKDKNII
ncbi:hypothetical protein [Streptobacillus moniliformis]|uniref:hypothetical protein n=1 Tax=Streptobacillus moniliformis TaxID=34105 RepID=UPI0007E39135|nr:hypothetical protein [Streptobacillus moniliformis]